jgi:hypothetical protein
MSRNLDALEGEAAQLRNEIAEALSRANQAALCLISLGRRLGRLEERIEEARSPAVYCDRHEGTMAPTSDGPPIIPDRLS